MATKPVRHRANLALRGTNTKPTHSSLGFFASLKMTVASKIGWGVKSGGAAARFYPYFSGGRTVIPTEGRNLFIPRTFLPALPRMPCNPKPGHLLHFVPGTGVAARFWHHLFPLTRPSVAGLSNSARNAHLQGPLPPLFLFVHHKGSLFTIMFIFLGRS